MSSNKEVREELEEIYGAKCMIHDVPEIKRQIKSYSTKKFKYKGKKIENQLTLHHLKPKRDNGATTKDNGAVVCRHCHNILESLQENERNQINNMIKDYKLAVAEVTTDGIKQAQIIEPNIEDYITIPLEKNRETKKQRRLREKRELKREMEELEL